MQLTNEDYELIEAANQQLRRVFDPVWHSVGSAIRLTDGTIYTGINVDASTGSGGGACAEMSALSAVISAGRKADVKDIVAVSQDGVLPPCGVCRQMLVTHAPEVGIIVPNDNNTLIKVTIDDLLPFAYEDPSVAG